MLRVVISAVGCLILPISTNVLSQELPVLMDLSRLKPEVIETEVVDRVVSRTYGYVDISPKKGEKIVVVTLKGMVTQACRVCASPTDFAAIYEEVVTAKGEKETFPFIRNLETVKCLRKNYEKMKKMKKPLNKKFSLVYSSLD